jgi:pyruvate dehydrogenase E2 component (dihydrolipoamide acetyltransferase)/2-oxoglutarate dehydrogenase E2 component (dihydrolipoamide succinyltransferase)
MPHDVTMPQLGMAQDAGKIVSWLKAPGDAVAKGDALLEVETDKAVMEVEAQANGYLTGVTAAEGEDVPVGQVIARISDSAEGDEAPPTPAPAAATLEGDLPDGHKVTMPQLGMAQDTGLLVTWLKAPGDQVAADDVLFEVETDKSTMEVEAGRAGWLAATLAHEGEEVPVGQPVAILSADKPQAPMARSVKDGAKAPAAPAPDTATVEANPQAPAPAKPAAKAPAAQAGGRILASPKARRLALEQGLDLARLVKAGHPQPYHVADLDVLSALPAATPTAGAAAQAPRRLTATCHADGLADFAAWVAGSVPDQGAILAGMAGASLGGNGPVTVAVDRVGKTRAYSVPPGRALSAVTASDTLPALILRDLRGTPVTSVAMGAEAVPVLSVTSEGAGLSITLECAADQLDAPEAIRLLTEFAGRMEHPLRHLL